MANPALALLPDHEYYDEAKDAYTIWAHHMGLSSGFEQLSNVEYSAWHAVVKGLYERFEDETPFCPVHATSALICTECLPVECSKCDTELICPECNGEKAAERSPDLPGESRAPLTRPHESAGAKTEVPQGIGVVGRGDAGHA
jgi:hypothetical protein